MRQRFIIKHSRPVVCKKQATEEVVEKKPDADVNNKKSKKQEAMMDIEQIEKLANELTPEQTTKKIKKDKGLIERTESSKIMITEDNKQLLKD